MAELKLKVFRAQKDALVYVEEKKDSHNFFIIKSGKAKIIRSVEISDNPAETMLSAGDYFGESVSISGNTAIVGAHGDDDSGFSSGAAYLFDASTAVVPEPSSIILWATFSLTFGLGYWRRQGVTQ